MFVDNRGPRPAVLGGSLLLAVGYFPLHIAYQNASGSVPLMCFFSYLTGLGGCMAFAAAVKTSALNWPHHRGTATAFPLAAFGLSALFFSLLGAIITSDPGGFLVLLAAGTCGLTFVGFFFLRVYPHQAYHPVSRAASLSDSQQLRRTSTNEGKQRARRFSHTDPGMSPNPAAKTMDDESISPAALEAAALVGVSTQGANGVGSSSRCSSEHDVAVDETSSLMSNSSEGQEIVVDSVDVDRSRRVDIRGLALLRDIEFWQLFSIMGILAGVGLMTIK